MDVQLKKGLLDATVLLIIAKGDAYGYKVTQDTMKILDVSESAIYPVLRRHETASFVETYSIEHNGRLRKYYKITERGIEKIQDYKKELIELKEVIEKLLKEVE